MILVTGGAGFIGSNIVAALSARGDAVAVCDFFGQDDKWHNLAKAELCDVITPEQLDRWLERNVTALDAVIHMGAISSTSATDANLVVTTNFQLSWFLWRWCALHRKRFIYASSAATYGAGERGYDDDGSPDALAALRPLNLYGWTKHLFDRRVARAVKDRESTPPQWAGLKFFNVYGPNEYHKGTMQSVVARNYRAVASGGEVALFKSYRTDVPDGEQRRDFIFVDDCVHVILWLLDNPTVNGLFNVGTGHAASFTELMQSLFAACGRPPQIKFCDMPDETRDHYQYFTEAKIDRLRAAGFTQPLTSVEQGVRRYVEHFLAKPDSYR